MSYSAPPFPFGPQPAAPAKGRALAVTALVVGVVAVVFSWFPVFGLVLGLTAAGLGVTGILKSSNRLMAILGTALGGLACLINVAMIAATVAMVDDVGKSTVLAPSASITAPVVVKSTAAVPAEPTTQAPEPVVSTTAPEPATTGATAKPVVTRTPVTEKPKKEPVETVAQQNARETAESYLESSSFSRTGLIHQLKYEGFTTAQATYGVDAVHANWSEQATRTAESYLESSSFSRTGLIHQLKHDGFSITQSTHGVDAVHPNWNKQAAKTAESYLETSSFSRSDLINQLKYEGFTTAQATYGVHAVGL
ncbi:Ltp family lipoprotein [Actinoplanes sp. N902-109]|uniref:Ltp family lipoprotein n=1 Tax=Actinoplanes sp. (strain N902-109) TaxID=649831 RepID=UPI0003294B73|nr:Ltp family lipoprotein [Actinoplanes sp. N902-109]AGL18153.1 hypothetical protein L083_4643 [Actinoplanes sp. N902-109]